MTEVNQKRKIVIVVVAAALLALLSLFIYLRVIFSPERFIGSFEETAAAWIGGEVEISSAYIRPGNIVLNDIKAYTSSYDDKLQSITVRRMLLGYRTLSAIKGEFVITSMSFDRPTLKVNRGLHGLYDYEEEADNLDIDGYSFKIENLRISAGKISYKTEDFSFVLEDIYFDFDRPMSANIASISGRGRLEGENASSLRLEGNIDFIRDRLTLDEINLIAYGGELSLTGRINSFFHDPNYNIRYAIDSLPHELMPEGFVMTGEPLLGGSIRSTEAGYLLDYSLDLSPVRLDYNSIIQKPAGYRFMLRGGLLFRGGAISLDWYLMEIGRFAFSGTGNINRDKRVNINMVGNDLDYPELSTVFPLWRKFMASGSGDLRATITGDLFDPVVHASIDAEEVEVSNFRTLEDFIKRVTDRRHSPVELGDVKAKVSLTRNYLNFDEVSTCGGYLQGRLVGRFTFGEELDLSVSPEFYGNRYNLRVSGSTESIRVDLK